MSAAALRSGPSLFINRRSLERFGAGPAIALIVTLSLFLLMRHLVAPPDAFMQDAIEPVSIEIGREIVDEAVRTKRTVVERPEFIPQPPPPRSLREAPREDAPNAPAPAAPPVTFEPPGTKAIERGFPTPLVRIPPDYPGDLARRGVEGVAVVCFDVGADGRPFNVRTCGAVSHPAFGRAAERAVKRWKYAPKIVNGEPVPFFGGRVSFPFRLNGGAGD